MDRQYRLTEDRLRQHFEQDEERRFEVEGFISAGWYGITWKLKYRATPAPDAAHASPGVGSHSEYRRIVLKIPSGPERGVNQGFVGALNLNARDQFLNEKDLLAIVRWARHLVHGVEIRNDPLTALFQSNPIYQGDIPWFYLEWIENGTLGRFVTRSAERYPRLPNRLLWRFFLCLVRMVVAMSWPPRQPNAENPQPVIEEPDGPPYAPFAHGDLFSDSSIGNIMVGELAPTDPNSEHAPYDATETSTTVRVNNKRPFRTFAEDILRRDGSGNLVYPWLDNRMRAWVCECLAQQPAMRADPKALLEDIKSMIRDRNEEHYANQPAHDDVAESDDAIRVLLNNVLSNA
ncbi:hypothetical protein F5Y08DRAFT_344243 [Xylaria arbuscula]|nr:hypothetical protein F5Y08DRAFT_344243 [Xylaria arbuscula]